jgi:AI-2 transport protein TqsA
MEKTIKNVLIIFLLILICYLMSALSSILLPLALAVLFAMLFQPIIEFLTKIKVPKFFILPIVTLIALGILFGLFNIIVTTFNEIYDQQDFFSKQLMLRLEQILRWLRDVFGLRLTPYQIGEAFRKEFFSSNWVAVAMGNVAGIGAFAGSVIIFILYYIILLFGLTNYEEYLEHVGKGFKNNSLLKNFEQIQKSIISYFTLKTLLNLSTGSMVALICWLFGLKFSIFIGLLVFVLLYIPSIGSIIAMIMPITMAAVQFDSINTILMVLLSCAGVLFIMGNLVEPKVMGHKLRLNTLTVIFGLVFWGYIWGIAGMILSVPLLVITKTIMEHIPDLNMIARIMESPPTKKRAKDIILEPDIDE